SCISLSPRIDGVYTIILQIYIFYKNYKFFIRRDVIQFYFVILFLIGLDANQKHLEVMHSLNRFDATLQGLGNQKYLELNILHHHFN
ncbi:hypothetical protein ACJX0J_032591, partial [Zea mays]